MFLIWVILVLGFLIFISIPILGAIFGVKFLDWITKKLEDHVNKS